MADQFRSMTVPAGLVIELDDDPANLTTQKGGVEGIVTIAGREVWRAAYPQPVSHADVLDDMLATLREGLRQVAQRSRA